MTGYFYSVSLVIIVAALVFVMTVPSPWMTHADFKKELVQVGIQVVAFGLVGGGIKLLIDRQQKYREFRADMLDRLGSAHRDVYRIRRLLQVSEQKETPALLGELMNVRQNLGSA